MKEHSVQVKWFSLVNISTGNVETPAQSEDYTKNTLLDFIEAYGEGKYEIVQVNENGELI
jgi:hypothetical protein